MTKVLSDNELIDLYKHWQESKKHPISYAQYAREHKLDVSNFASWHLKFNPWTGKYKKQKQNELYYAGLYKEKEEHASVFCRNNSISPSRLHLVSSHIFLMERINNLLDKESNNIKKESSMSFIEVPKKQDIWDNFKPLNPIIQKQPEKPQEQEVIKAQNDIELIITKGVKVIVSPQIGTEKFIKIIELLKDL
jgi:hypothetical protein